MRRTVFIAITAAPMAAMVTNTAHVEASDVDFVQLELGFALFSPGQAEGQVEAGRPGELIAPGLQFAHP